MKLCSAQNLQLPEPGCLPEELYATHNKSLEADMFLEDWMLNSFSPTMTNTWDFLKVEIESPLELKDWMISFDF